MCSCVLLNVAAVNLSGNEVLFPPLMALLSLNQTGRLVISEDLTTEHSCCWSLRAGIQF